MAKFNIAFQKMLSYEGGYVNDPDDRGGETYKGIARASHGNWPGWRIIDKYKANPDFPSLLAKDIDLQQDVDQFYWTNFWVPLNADRIQNQSMAEAIFDFGVNAITCAQATPNLFCNSDQILRLLRSSFFYRIQTLLTISIIPSLSL